MAVRSFPNNPVIDTTRTLLGQDNDNNHNEDDLVDYHYHNSPIPATPSSPLTHSTTTGIDSFSSSSSFTVPQNTTGVILEFDTNSNNKPVSSSVSSTIPAHSSLPSPLSPPPRRRPSLASDPSPPSLDSSMQEFIAAHPAPSFTAALPPRHPSSSLSSSSSTSSTSERGLEQQQQQHQHLARGALSTSALPYIETSPEAWLAHAAQQRRHFSTGSFSSSTSSSSSASSSRVSVLLSPATDMSASMVKSPLQQFPESERVVSEEGDSDADQEPELNAFVRPSQLRASLMERAKKSNQRIKTRSASMPLEQGLRLSIQSNQSLNSAYESRPSARSSMSSTISGWARARSSSVSSQESSGSVNLEALIAEGSDINEECPLDLEEGDDLEWSREQQQQQSRMQQPRSRNQIQTMSQSKCVSGEIPMQQVENQTAEENWDEYLSESDMVTEEDQEFGQTLKSFSQIALKSSTSSGVRGLGYSGLPTKLSTPTSAASRFAEGRNPYDLDGDSMETPSGLRDPRAGNRLSTVSTSSNTSSTSGRGVGNGSKLLAPGASRLPASGLKAPASRLVPPAATRSGLTQPKATSSAASKTGVGLTRPSGLPAPKSGLQAPKAAGSSAARSGVAKPAGGSGVAGPGRTGSLPRAASVGGLGKMATTTATGTARTGVPRTGSTSQLAAPLTIRRPGTGPSGISSIAVGNTAAKRQSLLPSATSASTSRISAPPGRLPAPGTRANSTRQNSIGSTLQLTSPSRLTSGRPASTTTYMVSPTSSQSSTSSMRSIPHDTVTPLSQRLSNATGTTTLPSASRLTKPGAGQRAVSMYGSNSRLYSVEREPEALTYQQEEEEEEDYSVLTPPQSPSSNKNVPGIGRSLGGIPRSGLKPPSASGSSSRLVPPSVTTTKSPRPSSPSPLSAGSNSSVGSNSFLARPRTPTSNGNLTTSSIPSYGSRLPTGLVSPRVGRH